MPPGLPHRPCWPATPKKKKKKKKTQKTRTTWRSRPTRGRRRPPEARGERPASSGPGQPSAVPRHSSGASLGLAGPSSSFYGGADERELCVDRGDRRFQHRSMRGHPGHGQVRDGTRACHLECLTSRDAGGLGWGHRRRCPPLAFTILLLGLDRLALPSARHHFSLYRPRPDPATWPVSADRPVAWHQPAYDGGPCPSAVLWARLTRRWSSSAASS